MTNKKTEIDHVKKEHHARVNTEGRDQTFHPYSLTSFATAGTQK